MSGPEETRGTFLIAVEGADGCGYLDANDDVVDVAVLVLFHAGGASADPSAEGGELYGVGFVAAHDAELGEFFFEVFADDAGLYAGHHVGLVDPT